jgi:hypothetical protein
MASNVTDDKYGTPRTDAFYDALYVGVPSDMVEYSSGKERDFCRQLERELGLERESHEVTKRMLADRDDALSARSAIGERIREAIANDRCDGESEWARGVNAARERHLAIIDALLNEVDRNADR